MRSSDTTERSETPFLIDPFRPVCSARTSVVGPRIFVADGLELPCQLDTVTMSEARSTSPAGGQANGVEQEIDELDYNAAHPEKTAPPRLPGVSEKRRVASLEETAFDIKTFVEESSGQEAATVLYLAYGSNLCAKTFKGVRGIQPLAQVNVVVPEIALTFDLPGLPYGEPCFANVAPRAEVDRRLASPKTGDETALLLADSKQPRYHKDRWKKGLVGVVYEVSVKDYATIISTEGGGMSYQDILVTCHCLPDASTVPEHPDTPPLKAHTLYAPRDSKAVNRLQRPDPSYAQPSARYLQLLLDGADEHGLPEEYKVFMRNILTYTITETRQRYGAIYFLGFWGTLLRTMFRSARYVADKKGRSPAWWAWITGSMFRAIWACYDGFAHPVFGNGERTVGDA